jgi:hypothetical protein
MRSILQNWSTWLTRGGSECSTSWPPACWKRLWLTISQLMPLESIHSVRSRLSSTLRA